MIQHCKTHLHLTFHNFKHAPNLNVCQLGRDFFETLKDTKYTLTSYSVYDYSAHSAFFSASLWLCVGGSQAQRGGRPVTTRLIAYKAPT